MAHPDLYDELAQDLIAGFDKGTLYARVDDARGLVWQHTTHGGMDDALPREQLLIASVIQRFIEETGDAHWEIRNDAPGIVFHDENEFISLVDLGVNKKLGFYRLSLFPSTVNDAGDY